MANFADSSDIEFLAYFCAQDLREMAGMLSDECGAISGNFVGDPAASGHV